MTLRKFAIGLLVMIFVGGSSAIQQQPSDETSLLADAQRPSSAPFMSMRTMMAKTMPLAMAKFPWSRKDKENGPPLSDNLGDYSHPISTSNETTQKYFDQGLSWTYGFNHAEAIRAFRKAQDLDPQCAMCYWGEAFALGPNINVPMAEQAVAPAFAAITRAQDLAATANPQEQAMIAALSKRYSNNAAADRASLDQAYADAMRQVASDYAADPEAATLFADSLMNLQPWDYWEPDGNTPRGNAQEAIDFLERVLAANSNHPGAIHFYIHMVEASTTPERAEPYADRLGNLVPGAGHLVHMPSHIYIRVGRHIDSIDANRKAAAADEGYLKQVDAEGIVPYGYYPHNVHFLMMSAQFAGDGETAIAAAEKLSAILSQEFAMSVGWVEVILSAPYFAHAQFSDASTILNLPAPQGNSALTKAMWHYARGIALATQGNNQAALAEAIVDIKDSGMLDRLLEQYIPATSIVDIAQLIVLGRVAQSSGDLDEAAASFGAAVAVQDSMPYMEPPFWYYPIRQSLGAVQLAQGNAVQAERTFHNSLDNYRNNAWSLYGLMEAQRALGRDVADTEKQFRESWAGKGEDLNLNRL